MPLLLTPIMLFIFYHSPPLLPRFVSNTHAPACTLNLFRPLATDELTVPDALLNATSCNTLSFCTPLASTAIKDLFATEFMSIPLTVAPVNVLVGT